MRFTEGQRRSRHFDLASFGIQGLKPRFLAGLPEPISVDVLNAATHRRLPAHSVVTNQGDTAAYLFLVAAGCARHFFITPEGEKLLLMWLIPGDVFGGATLLPAPSSYLVGTELIQDSSLIIWDRPTIAALAARHNRLLSNALAIASDYLVWYIATHSALVCQTARQRVAHVLTGLAEGVGKPSVDGIELVLSNEELANAANVTPFTASRLLGQWQRAGALVKSRGKIVLRDPQHLVA